VAGSETRTLSRLHGAFLWRRYDYACADSLTPGSCILRGTPQELAPRCNADPLCRAMIYLANGRDYLGPNLTDLKGGEGVMLDAASSTLNQNAAAYLKLASPPPSSQEGGGLSGAAIAGGCPLAAASPSRANAVHTKPCTLDQ
jgi:hypothetical protein